MKLKNDKQHGIKYDEVIREDIIMHEKPILFSGPMVRAILEGQKTQTRRVVKPQPKVTEGRYDGTGDFHHHFIEEISNGKPLENYYDIGRCPYGKIGDRLWIRETFGLVSGQIIYRANSNIINGEEEPRPDKWKPSIYMPKKYSRIWLEITDVSVEKIKNISNLGIHQEGTALNTNNNSIKKLKFIELWDSINKKRGFGWEKNPWVWVIKFRRL